MGATWPIVDGLLLVRMRPSTRKKKHYAFRWQEMGALQDHRAGSLPCDTCAVRPRHPQTRPWRPQRGTGGLGLLRNARNHTLGAPISRSVASPGHSCADSRKKRSASVNCDVRGVVEGSQDALLPSLSPFLSSPPPPLSRFVAARPVTGSSPPPPPSNPAAVWTGRRPNPPRGRRDRPRENSAGDSSAIRTIARTSNVAFRLSERRFGP